MFADQSRSSARDTFFNTWKKFKNNEPLEALEKIILEIIHNHPEYHAILENPDEYREEDFKPSQGRENPFLHMGLHMGLIEQLHTDRPQGILEVYKILGKKLDNPHLVEHKMIEVLAAYMWEVMRSNGDYDDAVYLERMKRLLS